MIDTCAATPHAQSDLLKRGYLPVFLGAVCISSAAFFVKDASVDPSAVAFYRLLFGGIALFAVAVLRRDRLKPHRRAFILMALAGLLFCGDLLFWHASIVRVGPGIATILTNLQVIFLALYGAVLLKECMSWPQRLSIPLALVGLILLLGLHRKSLPAGILSGVGLGILSAFLYACYVLTLRRTQTVDVRLAPVPNIAWISLLGAFFIGVYCAAGGVSLAIPDLRTGLTLAALGIFCQSVGWLLLSMGIPHLPPFCAGLIMLTQPALAYLWDTLFYGAAAAPVNIFGACLAIAAIGMGIYVPATKESSNS